MTSARRRARRTRLQRLAEVRVAEGDGVEATRLLQQALPLARSSIIAKHLLQRIFGTMILAASDAAAARAIVDRAESTLGWDDACPFCSIMLSVPASIACARAGDLEVAQRHLALAEQSAVLWRARRGRQGSPRRRRRSLRRAATPRPARELMQSATEQFQRAGQPLDAERCRRAMVAY